ncbi:MAG: arginine--tRNA ligase [Bacteroidetes bacterium]|nr:arginine--tRNA ligase [Bacteroidota bacterium]MDA0944299.1 arginine--tRNA ligase [Bacteroidota bacterium]
MNIESALSLEIQSVLNSLYGWEQAPKLDQTRPEFEGDFTLVVFPFVRASRKSPEATAEEIGAALMNSGSLISSYNVIKGFLNLVLKADNWSIFLDREWNNLQFGHGSSKDQKVMVEYASPNTNKPLHLGHMRNNFLGYSLSQLFKASGYEVVMANLINDRGIHICKSMLAWQRFGDGETPSSSGMKGDHLVGKYYVVFENALREQTQKTIELALQGQYNGHSPAVQERYQQAWSKLEAAKEDKQISKLKDDIKELVRNQSELMLACQDMLRAWEAGDPEVLHLWKTMNGWVYEGFDATWKRMGVSFDKFYYESDTYTLGKDLVQEGLEKGVFYAKEDGSVWIDLRDAGLDEKLVQRGDGTSVYITQDIGTAQLKYEEFGVDRSIYVVGNEQDYHFKVLFLIMERLGRSYASGMYHASYGMVDLPSGKMKSREGTVVDADDLLQEMVDAARETTEALGKTDGLAQEDLNALYETLALSALKFFILKVDPKKRMLFNPAESIDFQGDTGPFVQYSHARIRSILRTAPSSWNEAADTQLALSETETALLKVLAQFPGAVTQACEQYSPALVAQFLLDLAKAFNRVYNEHSFLKEPDAGLMKRRLKMAQMTANTLKNGLAVLGIDAVERM